MPKILRMAVLAVNGWIIRFVITYVLQPKNHSSCMLLVLPGLCSMD